MRQTLSNSDRGAGLVEYALAVLLIAMVSLIGVKALGEETSDSFDGIGTSLAAGEEESGSEDDDMTPDEKWKAAQEDYSDAIDQAKANKAEDLDKAKAEYDAARAAAADLPKDDRKAANQEAKDAYNAAKSKANDDYKTAVDSAKAARDAARDEWKSTR